MRAPSPSVTAAAAAEHDTAADDPSTAFDWRLGLALAGCAFEAYNDIESGEGSPSMRMTSLGGTEIAFVDKDFLRQKFAGLLEVTVKSASNLMRADWWPGAKSDPFVVLNVGDSAAITSVINQNLDPVWNETFYLFVSDPATQRLVVKVLDQDMGKADDLLGSAMRGLQDLAGGAARQVDLPLRGPQGATGAVSLALRFLPFDDVLASEAASSSMGEPVLGSPPAAITGSEWRTLQKEVLEPAANALFDPIAYVDNPRTDTQAWVFWNPERRHVCVAFRGTEQVKWKDILTDLRLAPVSLDPEGVAETPFWERKTGEQPASIEAAVAALQSKRMEFRASLADGLKGLLQRQEEGAAATAAAQSAAPGGEAGGPGGEEPMWVHEGFLEAYASVRPVVLRLLDTVLAGEQEPWTLYITGHSLGGALSTLCTFDCARRMWRTTPAAPRLVHYNYGSPRVGNRTFAAEFDRLVPNAWRVANANDAVTLVPRMLGYCHIGHKAVLGTEGVLELTRNSSRMLGEGADMANVALAAAVNLPKLAEQLLDKQGEEGSNAALLSAAAAVASAASALAAARQQAEDDGEVHTPEEVQAMLEEEVEAMQRLLDGSALNEHLEPLYLENLRAAIAKLGARGS
ncbi:hypothetical protein ABPG75_010385 [Micractinium tetrahymenae]